MLWLPIAIGAYFFGALASLADKLLLERRVTDPVAYTIYTGLASAGMILLAPFGFEALGIADMALAFTIGALYLGSLYFLFTALKANDPSRVIPLLGGTSPIFTLLFAAVVTWNLPRANEVEALACLIIGGVLLSVDWDGGKKFKRANFVLPALLSAGLLALSLALTKILLVHGVFLGRFIWIRLGSFGAALGVLVSPRIRGRLQAHREKKQKGASAPAFIGGKLIGAISIILLNYSIKLGPVAVVNALKGIEYVFIFLIVVGASAWKSDIFEESLNPRTLFSKLCGMIAISGGILLLVLP